MNIIKTNLKLLESCNFDVLTERVNIRENNGKVVHHLFLMANKDSGEILEISKQAKYHKDTAISCLSLSKTSLLKQGPYKIELLESENFSEQVADIILASFKIFNKDAP